jgi:hypothetical protein
MRDHFLDGGVDADFAILVIDLIPGMLGRRFVGSLGDEWNSQNRKKRGDQYPGD